MEATIHIPEAIAAAARARGMRPEVYAQQILEREANARPRAKQTVSLIVEDPEIQGGAPTFRGTRLLVYQVVELLRRGLPESELFEDYPNLTSAMIAAARDFAGTQPRRLRPRKPAWRKNRPVATHLLRRSKA